MLIGPHAGIYCDGGEVWLIFDQGFDSVGVMIKAVLGMITGTAAFLWGAPDRWIYTLLALIALDYASGIIAAAIEKNLCSKVGLAGILKKMQMLLIVALAHVLDGILKADGVARSMVIGFFVANEGISILENAARAGVSFPAKLLELLKQFNDKNGG